MAEGREPLIEADGDRSIARSRSTVASPTHPLSMASDMAARALFVFFDCVLDGMMPESRCVDAFNQDFWRDIWGGSGCLNVLSVFYVVSAFFGGEVNISKTFLGFLGFQNQRIRLC